MVSGRGPPAPARKDEIGLQRNDLLDVDAGERADDRHVGGLGREIRDVLDLADETVARPDGEQRLGDRRA